MPLARCNVCGLRAPTSEEHLISAPIGRVILGDLTIATKEEVLARLRDVLDGYEVLESNTPKRPARLVSRRIRNLICETCNAERFGPLEERAANALASFLLDDGAANAGLLRRWAWVFALKAYWASVHTSRIREGQLNSMFEKLLTQGIRVAMSVRLARLAPPASNWPFAVIIDRRAPMFSHVIFALRGTLWFVSPSPEDGSLYPFPTIELVSSIRLREHVPIITLAEFGRLESVRAQLGE